MKKYLVVMTCIASMLITGCKSYKGVPYIQNSATVDLSQGTNLYDAQIMPKDQLSITVNCPDNPQAAAVFNLTVQSEISNSLANRTTTQQAALQTYLVTNNGDIVFPLLGKIHVVGMTTDELETYIEERVTGKYLKERPIVTVTMSNFKYAVLGEVAAPGIYSTSTGKVNIFEALAHAKDMTIWGQRDNVKLIREDAMGKKQIVELNLNDANVINSPYYQLQQNDILYITPNKTKAKNSGVGTETSLWLSSTSILISLAGLMYNILK